MIFYTIGVYNSSESDFFNKLIQHSIDTFCDIRQRRGVRGSKYKFVNSNRLQERLKNLNINYLHIKELAPTKEIRELQKEADAKEGEVKRNRNSLGKVFTIAYKNKILEQFDLDNLIEKLKNRHAEKIVLFCVEEKPEACHRSIVANKLKSLGYDIIHL
jgi:uncharacterized protein (DUF488 family)